MDAGAPYQDLDEIEWLVARFVKRTLPCPEWTHRAHLTVGLCTLRDYPPGEALRLVRDGIRRYNTVCRCGRIICAFYF